MFFCYHLENKLKFAIVVLEVTWIHACIHMQGMYSFRKVGTDSGYAMPLIVFCIFLGCQRHKSPVFQWKNSIL